MPGRKTVFENGYFYHVYNRGSEKRNIFIKSQNYQRFIKTLFYYQYMGPKIRLSLLSQEGFQNFKPEHSKKLVEIICYCLMPNHFHFLIKQLKENGISKFISQVSNSYTKYFNTKYKRVGALFQGVFQAEIIESDDQLIHTSRYIHLNPVVSGICKMPEDYFWSSYNEYLNQEFICSTSLILDLFPSKEKYTEFTKDQIDYATTLEIAKHQLIDIDK